MEKSFQQPNLPAQSPLFDRFKLIRTCPVCSKDYRGNEVHLVSEQSGGHLVHITCGSCRSSVVSLVVESSGGMSTVAAMTDLSVIDITRLQGKESIGEDELLEFYKFLHTKTVFEKRIMSE